MEETRPGRVEGSSIFTFLSFSLGRSTGEKKEEEKLFLSTRRHRKASKCLTRKRKKDIGSLPLSYEVRAIFLVFCMKLRFISS